MNNAHEPSIQTTWKRQTIGLLTAAACVVSFYQNCAPMSAKDAPLATADKTTAPHPLDQAQKLSYVQWEGAARVIELALDHQGQRLSIHAVDAGSNQPLSCNSFDASLAYTQLMNVLASVELLSADSSLVCTMNLKDSVDAVFDDSTSLHFGFSRCDGFSANGQALKRFVQSLCPTPVN